MAQVLLISETKLKAYSFLHQNTDQALLTAGIFMAQEIHLQVILGTRGYDYYMNLVKSVQLSGATMSQADKIMLDEYIAPSLIWAGYYEILPELFAHKMNKAIVVGNTQEGTSVDIKGMQWYRDNAAQKYQFYFQRLMDRVMAYPNDYPWYFSYTNKDGMPNSKQNYFSGIHIAPGIRRPLNKDTYGAGLPKYWGMEYECCGDW